MEPDNDTSDQVARMRSQVETLMNERVTPALSEAASQAESALCAMRERAATTSGYIRAQPLQGVFIAAAIGFMLGRIFG